jgi:hypothetical protein
LQDLVEERYYSGQPELKILLYKFIQAMFFAYFFEKSMRKKKQRSSFHYLSHNIENLRATPFILPPSAFENLAVKQ